MGWATKLLVMSFLGLAACQQRSISSGGRRRQRVPAGKSDVASFNCPEDFGYYPHPSDCTQYYVCVFGGALQESCTGGLVYSHELQTCDWPRNVVCNLSPAGSGVSTVRITDPRTQGTNSVRGSTEPLTPSVGSFDVRFQNSLPASQSLRASESFSVFESNDKSRQPKFLRQESEPHQSLTRFPQQAFADTAVQESSRRPVNVIPTTTRTIVFPPSQPDFRPAVTSRPSSRPAPTHAPAVSEDFYGDFNLTDADYLYYYDDLLYDYYDVAPTAAPVTRPPVRRPTTTLTPAREELFETQPPPPPPPPTTTTTTTTTTTSTTSTTTTTPSPRTTTSTPTSGPKLRPVPVRIPADSTSNSKSFSRGGSTRSGSSLSSSRTTSSLSPSSSLRAATTSSSSPSQSLRVAPTPETLRGGLDQLFEFSTFPFDSARDDTSLLTSSISSSAVTHSFLPTFSQSQPLRQSQTQNKVHSGSRSQSQTTTSASHRLQPHPARVPALGSHVSSQPISQNTSPVSTSQALRASIDLSATSPPLTQASLSLSSSSEPSFSSSSSLSNTLSQSSSSPFSSVSPSSSSSSSSSRVPTVSQNSSRQPPRIQTPAPTQSSQRQAPVASGPIVVDDSIPKRPAPSRQQPPVDSKATKCDPKVCRLPDCYCGGKDVPGGFAPESVPQIVLLTFDDAVNDLNKGLYRDLFEVGRTNPNGCPIVSTMYVSHEWTDYTQVQNLYAEGHEIASHSVSHSFGEQFSVKKWAKEIAGQREILAAYGGVKMEDVRGMRAPFLAVGGNKMFKMLYDQNFTYDSSMPVYENKPPSWPYTLDYKIFHDCMIPPCPTNSYPGVWEVPMVMWQDLNGGRCSMGDACTTPPDAEGVYKMLIKNFERHYTSNRAPFGLFYHAAWFTTQHHKEGFIAFLDTITAMDDVWLITNHQLLQWMRDPQPLSTVKNFAPFGCNFPDRKKCTSTKVCNVWHKGGVRYMRTCQQCPEKYPWTGNTGIRSPLNDP